MVSLPGPGTRKSVASILVAEGMAADDDRFGPAGDETGDVPADDRLAKDRAADDIADGAVRRLPHLFQAKLLHPPLVRGDGRALDADPVFFNRLRRLDRHFILGGVAILHRQDRNT